MNYKKIVSLLTGALLTAALLTGCAASAAPAGSAAGTSASSAASAGAAEADDELARIQKAGSIKVGVEGTYPPVTYHDENGDLVGFDIDVAKAVAQKLGVKAEFVESEWDSLLAGVDSGRLDTVINAVSITDEREEKYDFAGPYFYITRQVVVRTGNDDLHSLDDLKGKKVATNITNDYAPELEKLGVTIVPIETSEEAATLVLSGRADFCMFNDTIFKEYLTQHPDAALSVAFRIPGEVEKIGIPVRKGETRLQDAIQQALDELASDGTLAKISQQYYGADYTKEP